MFKILFENFEETRWVSGSFWPLQERPSMEVNPHNHRQNHRRVWSFPAHGRRHPACSWSYRFIFSILRTNWVFRSDVQLYAVGGTRVYFRLQELPQKPRIFHFYCMNILASGSIHGVVQINISFRRILLLGENQTTRVSTVRASNWCHTLRRCWQMPGSLTTIFFTTPSFWAIYLTSLSISCFPYIHTCI